MEHCCTEPTSDSACCEWRIVCLSTLWIGQCTWHLVCKGAISANLGGRGRRGLSATPYRGGAITLGQVSANIVDKQVFWHPSTAAEGVAAGEGEGEGAGEGAPLNTADPAEEGVSTPGSNTCLGWTLGSQPRRKG